MRRLLCLTVLLAACGGGETATTDSAAADSTAVAAPAPAPAALTAQDLAGTFNGTSYPEGSANPATWTMVTSVGADNAVTSKLIFAGSTDSIPVRIAAIEGDSVRMEMGPYKLGGTGPEVNTMITGRKTADGMAGTFMAHPVAKPDSTITGRWESKKVM